MTTLCVPLRGRVRESSMMMLAVGSGLDRRSGTVTGQSDRSYTYKEKKGKELTVGPVD